MIETVIADLATAALLRMGRQIETAAKAGRNSGEEARMALALGSFDFSASPLRLRIELPEGVSSQVVAKLLASPEASAVAFEVLTLILTESLTAARQRIFDRWSDVVVRANPLAGPIADQLLEAVMDHYEIAVGVVRDDFPNAYARLKDESQHRRIACILEAIHDRLGGEPAGTTPGEMDVFIQTYRRQVLQAHKYITPPDFDRRKDVAIEELYVSPTITADRALDREVVDLLNEVDRTVLLGDPGNGKSTASHVMIYEAAKDDAAPLPFLVILREFAGPGLSRSVVDYLEDRLSTVYQCRPPEGFVEHVLETGQALVVFDGLDELLDTSHRRAVTDAVGLFCNRYPLVRTLVTSRRVGYHQAPMDRRQFQVFELSGFDPKQVEEYVEKWFKQLDLTTDEVASWTAAFMRESYSVRDLTRNPLLLALMCIIYRGERSLPRNRPAVYERCATMLFDKWDGSRGIHSDLRAGQLVDPAMKHLAYWLFSKESGDGVTESALVKETTAYLLERSFEHEFEAEAAAHEFVEFCRGRAWVFSDVGTTPDGEPLYKFTHRTFLEYFAAYHLSRTIDTPEKLARTIAPKVANAEWDVVAQLAVQIADRNSDKGATRVFDVLLNDPRRRTAQKRANVIAFLTRCLSFVHLSPVVLRQLVRESLLVLVGNADLDGRTDPITALLANARYLDEEIIDAELRTALIGHVEGEDDARREVALSLIGAPQIIMRRAGLSPTNEGRWARLFGELADSYRAEYENYFGKDLEFSILGLRHGWVSLSDLLESFDDRLVPIMVSTPIRTVTNSRHIGHGRTLLIAAMTGRMPAHFRLALPNLVGQLAEVADHAEKCAIEGNTLLDGTETVHRVDSSIQIVEGTPLSDRELLGAGILMACMVEVSSGFLAARDDWGVLGRMASWLALRGQADVEKSAPWAPDDGPFELLNRWVRGEVDFVLNAPRKAGGRGVRLERRGLRLGESLP